MICSYCDAPMPDYSGFCPACGRSTAVDEFATSGPRERILSVVAYMALLPAIILLLVPPLNRSRFIRFHAWQSILFSTATILLGFVLRLMFVVFAFLPLLAWILLGVGTIAVCTLWLVLVVKAAQGTGFELPFLGPLAARLAAPSTH
jgi:uncharacterized membrane protein